MVVVATSLFQAWKKSSQASSVKKGFTLLVKDLFADMSPTEQEIRIGKRLRERFY